MATSRAKAEETAKNLEKPSEVFAAKIRELKASIGTLDQHATCYFCRKKLSLVDDVQYGHGVNQDATTRFVLKEKLPGYRCTDCELEFTEKNIREQFEAIVESAVDAIEDDQDIVQSLGLVTKARQHISQASTPAAKEAAQILEVFVARLRELKADMETPNKQACCMGCGKTLAIVEDVDYEYGFRKDSTERVILKTTLPGYRCSHCDLDFRDRNVSAKFKSTLESAVDGVDDYQKVVAAVGPGEISVRFSGRHANTA